MDDGTAYRPDDEPAPVPWTRAERVVGAVCLVLAGALIAAVGLLIVRGAL